MIGAYLAFAVLVGQVPASDPMVLVTQLGSARYAQREAAAAALERLGRTALPALQTARDVKDPEIRARASSLITKIEGALLTKPTMVALDFHDQPIAEVVRSFSDQAGIKMAIYPEQPPALQQKRITLQESAPLPFWKALDRLCDAGQLQYNFGMHGMPNAREPVFPLFSGAGRPAGPMSDHGPFRVNLVGLHYQRHVQFFPTGQPLPSNRVGLPPNPVDPKRPGYTVNEEFYAQIQVAAEPRLSVSQNGPLKLVEAIDERGQSLLIPENNAQTLQRQSAYFGLTAGPNLHLQAPLRRPEQPGQEIKRLRGVLPVVVATRKGNPLVVPLSGSSGKSFRNDEATVEVQEIRVNPNTNQTNIQIAVRTNRTSGGEADLLAALPTAMGRRSETSQQQLEVVDGQGKLIPWYLTNDAEGSRMTLTLTPQEQGAATEIRYYAMVRAVTDVNFEFTDVPLP
ncbi:hypothetical protein SAMN05444166_6971 [Singulisphaera sp. GP187]|uniref:hypothetical protein n=1 Tax=Singulisphaera sp. GP187 TaxID=1882752 RepID=UPI000928A8B8|nr:hypothetical protein [Singulisphaera sp. GP187]SIO62181.1 hypothetical protein SAMN05444166_6971 [Singulisphaera sp. GP187]